MRMFRHGDCQLTTTVGDLVNELLKFDQNAYVFTEGCDCTGNVVSVSTCDDGTVLIERDDSALVWNETYTEKTIAPRYLERMGKP